MSPEASDLLRQARTIAVVGLSSNPLRSSHGVAEALQRYGYRIIPVNPNETTVLGEKSYPALEDIPEPVDIVNVFRRPAYVPPIVDAAIRIGAKGVWMQVGIADEPSAQRARQAGLVVVEDSCIMVARSLLGR